MMRRLEELNRAPLHDYSAQQKAIDWLLDTGHFDMSECVEFLEELFEELRDPEHWRTERVSWNTVKGVEEPHEGGLRKAGRQEWTPTRKI
jgi:hypothetical protein